jgi:alkylhydroperoxidase family enzyme
VRRLRRHAFRASSRTRATGPPRRCRRRLAGCLVFSEAERAALALTESATRLADRPDPVADDVWDIAARHYTEAELAALVLAITAINAWNRLNAATQQISGDWVEQWIRRSPVPHGAA